jgi:hypothetical protein
MKHTYTFRILFALVAALGFSACSRNTVSLNAMRPAEITFPSYVKTIVIVDRTEFDKKGVNVLESILTGELPGEDKAAVQEAMNSFQVTLMNSPRFKVKKASEILKGNSLTSAFPEAIAWSKIEALCSLYGAEAVVAFEMFDSDFVPTGGKRLVKKKVKDANGVEKEIEVEEFYAQGVANVNMGIRMYDPKARTIVDQQRFTQTRTWQAVGNSVQDALLHLIAKTEATRILACSAGDAYAYKIAPMPIRITRNFYAKSRKSEELAEGGRMANVNDWLGAIDTWESGLPVASRKDAGKLCYDIAVAYEVIGDLQSAKKWAQRGYTEFRHKDSRTYARTLDYRIAEEEQVKKQMN